MPDPALASTRAPSPRRSTGTVLAAAVLLATGLAACGDDSSDEGDDASDGAGEARQEEVAERGAEVMPFDLDATMHQFEPTDDGLVQRVVADDPEDTTEVERIEEHLREEADSFAVGDFSDPASIHGEDMPGLAALEAGADQVTATYEAIPGGAVITYTTDVPGLVEALHDWADAQVDDHGEHAEHTH